MPMQLHYLCAGVETLDRLASITDIDHRGSVEGVGWRGEGGSEGKSKRGGGGEEAGLIGKKRERVKRET